MSGYEKLMKIQTSLKAPKNLYNSFGKYKYRNAESICEAVKPFLAKEKCTLVLRDFIEEVAGRIYVCAMAELTDCETGEVISAVKAYAREPEEKKGMDESQITGTASSYARKYALNGLFLLDDTKDADSDEYHEQTKEAKAEAEIRPKEEEVANKKISKVKVNALKARCEEDKVSIEKLLACYKVKAIEDFTERQLSNINQHWEDIKKL